MKPICTYPPLRTELVRFPGEIAGASLKQAGASPGGAQRSGFPGEIAGASLKPLGEEQRLPHRPLDSPAKSPGPH